MRSDLSMSGFLIALLRFMSNSMTTRFTKQGIYSMRQAGSVESSVPVKQSSTWPSGQPESTNSLTGSGGKSIITAQLMTRNCLPGISRLLKGKRSECQEVKVTMRRSEKEIKDKSIITEVLNTCHIGRLGTISGDGYPMVKPLNFAYHDGKIYFHTATEGEKIEDIKRDNRVCFEVDLPIAYVKARNNPCEADYLYRSVIIKGRARVIEDRNEKLFALNCLMEKHQPSGGYGEYTEAKLAKVGIVRVYIDEMTGKEDLGNVGMREIVLKALKENVKLPITIDRR